MSFVNISYSPFQGIEDVSYDKDDDAGLYKDPTWFTSGSDWLMVTPFGLRSILSWIGDHYPGVDVYVTENGVSDKVQVRDRFKVKIITCNSSSGILTTFREYTTTNTTLTKYSNPSNWMPSL